MSCSDMNATARSAVPLADRKVVRVSHEDQLTACLVCQAGHGRCGIDRDDPMPTLSK